MKLIKHIPNFITLTNVFFGCMAAIYFFEGDWMNGIYFIGLGMFADFFDGAAARGLNVKSNLGKELDSLADMLSFGFIPGLIIFLLLKEQTALLGWPYWVNYMGFVLTMGSAYRLAKFNLDTRQSENFIGMPTPAITIVTLGLVLLKLKNPDLYYYFQHPIVLIFICFVLTFLLNSEIGMFSLKMKGLKWNGNEIKIIFAIISIILGIIFTWSSLLLIMIVYILMNFYLHFFKSVSKT